MRLTQFFPMTVKLTSTQIKKDRTGDPTSSLVPWSGFLYWDLRKETNAEKGSKHLNPKIQRIFLRGYSYQCRN